MTEQSPLQKSAEAAVSRITILHNEIVAFRHELRLNFIRLEAKIDSKPSLTAMVTAITIAVFGMAGVIASTITVLHTIGFIRP